MHLLKKAHCLENPSEFTIHLKCPENRSKGSLYYSQPETTSNYKTETSALQADTSNMKNSQAYKDTAFIIIP